MGRLPKPAGTARNRNATLAALSAARMSVDDRATDVPNWPIGEPDDLEDSIWRQLWAVPQSVMWSKLGYFAVVARYARLLAQLHRMNQWDMPAVEDREDVRMLTQALSQLAGAYPKLLQAAQQLEDRLGLSPLAMQRLRWVIEDAEPVADEPPAETISARERIKATA